MPLTALGISEAVTHGRDVQVVLSRPTSPLLAAVMWSYLLSDLAPAATGARSLRILEKSQFRH